MFYIILETAQSKERTKTLKATAAAAARLDRATLRLHNLAVKLQKMFNHLAQPCFTCVLVCVEACKRYYGSHKHASPPYLQIA